MTLHTSMAILKPIDPRAAFDLALEAICTAGGARTRIAGAMVDDECDGWSVKGSRHISTTLGQGLPGITDCTFIPGAPLHTEDYFGADEDYEPDETRTLHTPRCHLVISWDTAYGYEGGPASLHSRAITFVYKRLGELGNDAYWCDEFTGQWHTSLLTLSNLRSGGAQADAWFRGTVLPALAAVGRVS